ncbi:AsnC family transcriptional regulator [Pseudodesulfovibrio indicus]|uniref:AsnC family transcriptional regulator n=2 Tax=Pseudodesulfovibrio indicus TaxID=1716143 RepID=A0A126QSW5_9BACT|nr:Lrp/AsnC family transcriptional regulator [Pseudodesulfovibrio indicus]AMK12902.1 AsnC family transcriptional regulator [Pseudodesulfovibrio indicus]TDT87938.1 AsnC family transcriptional regulator [Pseudodesulfovibrio indicus]
MSVKTLDEKDIGVLRLLQEDGRMANAKLAEQLAMSEASCWRRLKRLLDDGVIKGFQALLNRKALGFGVLSFVQLSCSRHSEKTTKIFENIIKASPNVLSCHNTTGDDDFLLQVVAKDMDDYSDFIEGVIRKIPGVVNIRSNISLREIKASSRLPLG